MLPSLLFALIKLALASSDKRLSPLDNQLDKAKDEIKSSNNAPLKTFSNTKGVYDPAVINLISKAFHYHNLFIPKSINQRIVEYTFSHDETINEYLDRIMNELRKVTRQQQQIFLNPYSFDFMPNLLNLLKNNKRAIPFNSPFWYDLERFLFKYALLMKKKFVNDNERLFEKSVKNIKDIVIIIRKKISFHLNDINIESMANFNFSMFDHLMGHEIFDHPHLLEFFVKNIIDDHENLKMTIDQIEKEECNDDFSDEPLLKLMLDRFAYGDLAVKQIENREWVADKNIIYYGYYSFVTALPHIYSKEEEERKHEVDDIESLWTFYISQSTIKFFLDNNLQFRMDDSSDFIRFLRRLEYMKGLPKGVALCEIIKFHDDEDENIFKWDEDIFENYLKKEREENGISQEEYERLIKLIE